MPASQSCPRCQPSIPLVDCSIKSCGVCRQAYFRRQQETSTDPKIGRNKLRVSSFRSSPIFSLSLGILTCSSSSASVHGVVLSDHPLAAFVLGGDGKELLVSSRLVGAVTALAAIVKDDQRR